MRPRNKVRRAPDGAKPHRRRKAVAAGLGKVSARSRSTACRTAPRALPMRLRHWRRRRDATNSRKPRLNVSRLRMQTTTPQRHNWPDLRGGGEPAWPCQWCHGAAGIGLARAATVKRGAIDTALLSRRYRPRGRNVRGEAFPARSTRFAAARSATSNSSARRAMRSAAATCASWRRKQLAAVLQSAAAARRLPLEQRQAPVQSRPVSWSCRRRLHGAAAGRRVASQCHHLAITGTGWGSSRRCNQLLV